MMATPQEQLTVLREALRSGVLSTSFEGKSAQYRSLEEIRSIIASLEAEIAGGAGAVPKSAVVRSSKGWI
jgi:hypothetical protein